MAATTGETRDAAVSGRSSVRVAADAGVALALALVLGVVYLLDSRISPAAPAAAGCGRGERTSAPSAATPSATAARPGGGPDPEGGRQQAT